MKYKFVIRYFDRETKKVTLISKCRSKDMTKEEFDKLIEKEVQTRKNLNLKDDFCIEII